MSIERVLLVPDTHGPYHDKRAWRLMMRAARDFKPHTVVHLGDLADFMAVSSHSKDPARLLSLRAEVEAVRALRADLDSLKPKRKVFIEGNHEDRLRRYLQDKAPELFGMVTADDLLELSKNNWEFTPYRQSAKLGKINLTHDTGHGGKYSTARALDTFNHSVVISHHHAIQYFVAGDATGKYRVGAQFGWLGDMSQIDWMHRVRVCTSWALGFGIGYHEVKTGVVWLQPCPIVNYAVCLNGKVFKE